MRILATICVALLLHGCHGWDWWEKNVHQKIVKPVVKAVDKELVRFDKHVVTPTVKAVDKTLVNFDTHVVRPTVKAIDKGLVKFDEVVLTPFGDAIKRGIYDTINQVANFDKTRHGTHVVCLVYYSR